MLNKTISQLLRDKKEIAILCSDEEEQELFLEILGKCTNLKWKSGSNITDFKNRISDETVYFIAFPKGTSSELELCYGWSTLIDVSDSHVFTVQGFIDHVNSIIDDTNIDYSL